MNKIRVLKSLYKTDQRLLAEKILDLANAAVAALVFGQALSSSSYNLDLALLGALILIFTYIWVIIYLRER